jgi:hypothetical protein
MIISLQERFAVRAAVAQGSGANGHIAIFARGILEGFNLLKLYIHTHVTTGVSL